MQSDARLMRVQLGCASIEFMRARKDMRLNMLPFAIEVESLKNFEQRKSKDYCCKYGNKKGKLVALYDILFRQDA